MFIFFSHFQKSPNAIDAITMTNIWNRSVCAANDRKKGEAINSDNKLTYYYVKDQKEKRNKKHTNRLYRLILQTSSYYYSKVPCLTHAFEISVWCAQTRPITEKIKHSFYFQSFEFGLLFGHGYRWQSMFFFLWYAYDFWVSDCDFYGALF